MHDVTKVYCKGIAYAVESTASNPAVSESLSPAFLESLQDAQNQAEAKRYSKIKMIIGIGGTVLTFVLIAAVLALGISAWVETWVLSISDNPYTALLIYAGFFGLAESFVAFPMRYYSGFYLEHKYRLSNQTFLKWLWEGIKAMLVSLPLATPILLVFYYCLRSFGGLWWIPVGSVLFLFSVVLARVGPILIFPLFYKFKPIEDEVLKKKILALCDKAKVKVEGIYVFNLSKNTKKANAAFTGIGKSRRIILGDTLIANFNDEEIESVFSHELGHFMLGHIWTMIAVGTASSFLGLYLTAVLYEMSLPWFGFTRIDQLAALPLLILWLGLYSLVTTPLSNMISRAHERAADRYALQTTGNRQAFINAMRKLARLNLADADPHPLVEFLLHSHPSIRRRIEFATRGAH